jgi:hypothetical protein
MFYSRNSLDFAIVSEARAVATRSTTLLKPQVEFLIRSLALSVLTQRQKKRRDKSRLETKTLIEQLGLLQPRAHCRARQIASARFDFNGFRDLRIYPNSHLRRSHGAVSGRGPIHS